MGNSCLPNYRVSWVTSAPLGGPCPPKGTMPNGAGRVIRRKDNCAGSSAGYCTGTELYCTALYCTAPHCVKLCTCIWRGAVCNPLGRASNEIIRAGQRGCGKSRDHCTLAHCILLTVFVLHTLFVLHSVFVLHTVFIMHTVFELQTALPAEGSEA